MTATRLSAALARWNVTLRALELETAVTRQHLGRIASGRAEPTRAVIAAIVSGIRRLTLAPFVPEELFELSVEEGGAWHDESVIAEAHWSSRERATALIASLQNVPLREWFGRIRRSGLHDGAARELLRSGRAAVDTRPRRAASLFLIAIHAAELSDTGDRHLILGLAWMEYGNALRHLASYDDALAAFDRAESTQENEVAGAHARRL